MQIRDYYFNTMHPGQIMNLYLMPDCHFGSPAFLEKEFERLADIIEKDPFAYTIFQGDLLDSNRPSTRELKRIAYASRKEEQMQSDERDAFWIDKMILPKLKRLCKNGRCLGMLDGDHFISMENGCSSTQSVCIKLGVPYLGDGQAILRIHFAYGKRRGCQSCDINIHVQHGIGGSGRLGSGINRLEDMANIWDNIEIFMRGHSHKGFIVPTSKYYVSEKSMQVSQRDIWLVNSPSFRTGMIMGSTDYAESRCYSATAHKFPVVHFTGLKTTAKNNGNFLIKTTCELI